MLMGNLMKWKFRLPGFMKSTLRAMTERTIQDILTKDNWKDAGVRQAVANVRQGQAQLGYTPGWMAEYAYNVIILAKKEPKPADADVEAAKAKLGKK